MKDKERMRKRQTGETKKATKFNVGSSMDPGTTKKLLEKLMKFE